jgi:hypothetical protein
MMLSETSGHNRMLRVERPRVVETWQGRPATATGRENGDYIYGKRRLREIDQRIRFLTKRPESAEVVDPGQQKRLDQVFLARPLATPPRTEPKIRSRPSASTKPIRSRPGQLGITNCSRTDESA